MFAQELAATHTGVTSLLPPFEPRPIFAAARAGDPLAREIVAEEARRIALHVLPVAAVADVDLVVLGGGIGANGDLLLEPIRTHLAARAPVPAARRGVGARRGGGADRRARDRRAGGARERAQPVR